MKEIIEVIKKNKRSVLLLATVVLGLILVLSLVARQQFLRSRASEGALINAFEIKDPGGNHLDCSSGSCQTQSLDVKIKIRDLEPLKGLRQ